MASLDFKEFLEAVSETEEENRKPGLGRNGCRQVYSCTADDNENEKKIDKEKKRDRKSKTPAFHEDSKDIFNIDIVTSKFDQPTGSDVDSTRNFLSEPRPLMSSSDDDRPLVIYKYKTLTGSSAILSGRRRNAHSTAEKEYRALKAGIAPMESRRESKKGESVPNPPRKESTQFKKYIDSLWNSKEKKNFELVRTKEIKLNFFPEPDLTVPNLTYTN